MKVTITGQVGEGKTTLMQLIVRAIRRSKRECTIDIVEDEKKSVLEIFNFKGVL